MQKKVFDSRGAETAKSEAEREKSGEAESRTCEENVSSVQDSVLVRHLHDVQVQLLQSFFHDFCLNPEKRQRRRSNRQVG